MCHLVKRHSIKVVQFQRKTEFMGDTLDFLSQELDYLGASEKQFRRLDTYVLMSLVPRAVPCTTFVRNKPHAVRAAEVHMAMVNYDSGNPG